MNFELLDNLIQVTLLGIAALASVALALRYQSRRLMLLAFGYACFSMGTLFFLLHIAVTNYVPSVFYVSELSWLGAYLFFLSLQIVRMKSIRLRPALLPGLAALWIAATILIVRVGGPSWLVSGSFAIVAGFIIYLSLFRWKRSPHRAVDICFLVCVPLQVLLYEFSVLSLDFTRFNVYYAVDISLTLCLLALLPLTLREVKQTL